jgi:hypothetical protein
MKSVLLALVCISALSNTYALQISEIMSNPSGDDSGREWIELYNNSGDAVDLSALTISIKGGNPDTVTSVSGGTTVPPQGYAIIGSTVSGQTKFLEDYPGFTGPLFKSSISLVNTSVTSLSVSLNGVVADTLASYTAAKDGKTLSFISGSFQAGTPTPGAANQAAPVEVAATGGSTTGTSGSSSAGGSSQSSESRVVSSPGASFEDIVVTLPSEKIVIAGAETDFAVKAATKSGKSIPSALITWAFGDGGQKVGSSTKYTYAYTGRYIAQVEVFNESTTASGRMIVKVISPEVEIASVGIDKYGTYVDVTNSNTYELNLSQWRITFDGASFPFPKNTIIAASSTVRFSGQAMGFASIPVTASTTVKILFPHLEEVTRYIPKQHVLTTTENFLHQNSKEVLKPIAAETGIAKKRVIVTKGKGAPQVLGVSTSTIGIHGKVSQNQSDRTTYGRDTRLASWVRGLFDRY